MILFLKSWWIFVVKRKKIKLISHYWVFFFFIYFIFFFLIFLNTLPPSATLSFVSFYHQPAYSTVHFAVTLFFAQHFFTWSVKLQCSFIYSFFFLYYEMRNYLEQSMFFSIFYFIYIKEGKIYYAIQRWQTRK